MSVYCPVLCVFGRDTTETLPHVSCPQNQMSIGIDACCVLLLNVDLAAAEQREDSCFLRSGQRRCTFPPLTSVPPALHESS